MKMLLDTHALLWFVLDDPRLSGAVRPLIEDPTNEVFISPASYWEIAIKISLRKYSVQEPYGSFMEDLIGDNQLQVLPIEPRHAAHLMTLPYHHRDPFDRLLIAQAIHENMPVVSRDTAFDEYPVTRLW